jgi:signal transduction histidine kinase
MRIQVPAWEKYGESRVRLAYTIALIGLLAFATFTLLGFRDTAQSSAWVNHTYQVLDKLEDCFSSLNEVESAQRGFLITRDNAFLSTYRKTIAQVERDENDLQRLLADNAVQLRRLAQLKELVARRVARLDEIIAMRALPNAKLKPLVPRMQAGAQLRTQVRDLVDVMEKTERGLLESRLDATAEHGTIALVFFGATTISAILLLTGVFNLLLQLLRSFAESRDQQLTYSSNLEQEVERTQIARRELERSNRELQDFAFVASHDLQEPLRKIRSYGDRMKRRLGSEIDELSLSDLSRIQNAAERMQVLINDILSLSRVTSKAQPFTPVDLNRVFDEVVEDLETRIGQAGAKVTRGDLPTMFADAIQMRQLLQNLIGNALKFAREGVRPVVRVENMATPPSGMSGFVVTDNGIGFEDKHAEKIFTVFQRLHNRAEYEGTGVGLAICRRIVERHGGYILAKGVVGEGASFTVALPKANKKRNESQGRNEN